MLGSQILVKTLVKAGVKKIFSLSGNQIMSIYDACIDEKINIIHTRHEGAAVSMAEAWSQLTNEIGVVLVTAAQGYTNSIGPLFSVKSSDTPLLLISGDSPVEQDGKGAFQELDQTIISSKLTKLSLRIENIMDLEEILRQAIRTALTQKTGPVHLAIPEDILEKKIKNKTTMNASNFKKHISKTRYEDLELLRGEMESSKRPLIILGPSLNNTRTNYLSKKLITRLNIPTVVMESPRGINDPSLGKLSSVLKSCDKIFCFAKTLDFTLSFGNKKNYAKNCKWFFISSESQDYKKIKINLKDQEFTFILADPFEVAKKIRNLNFKNQPWLENVNKKIDFRPKVLRDESQISSSELCFNVQKFISNNSPSIVVSDGGEFGQWAQSLTKGTKRLINGPSGAIGSSLPYAISAKLAYPKYTVFAFMGDGTAGFHFSEFETAVRYKLPIIVIIGNDKCWNAEHQIQVRKYGKDRLIGCELSDARYDKAVEALGGYGELVTDIKKLESSLKRAKNSKKPSCLNVLINGQSAPILK